MRSRFPPLCLVTCLAGVNLCSKAARAGNEDELFVGNRASLAGGAVTATVKDGSSTWYNTAGLAAADRDSVDVSGTVYSLRFYSVDGFIRSRLGGREDASVRELIAAPTQVAYVRRLSESTTLGLGYFVPRTANLVLREHLDERVGDVFSQWTVEAIVTYQQYVFGAALGFELGPGLRMGAGVLGTYETLTEAAAIFGSVAVGGTAQRTGQADSLTTQALVGVEPAVGLQADVSPELTLAVSARGPRFSLYNAGKTQTNFSRGVSSGPSTATLAGASDEVPIEASPLAVVRSGRYYAAAAYRTGDGWISAGVDIQPSLIDRAASVFRETTWNARVGTYQPISEKLAFGGGLFTDRAPAAAEDDPLVFSGADFYGGSVGAEFTNERALDESERVESLVFSTTASFRYAYASGKTFTLLVDPEAAPSAFFEEVRSDIDIHEVSVYVGSGLYF